MTAQLTNPITSFLYLPDQRPVLVFSTAEHAKAFAEAYPGGKLAGRDAEIYADPTHVFLPRPLGLELVRSGPAGVLLYVFHEKRQADHWVKKLVGVGAVLAEGNDVEGRTVVIKGQ